ncbi:hypothetical protein ACFLYR_00100 [Chloroflexota bacterium]
MLGVHPLFGPGASSIASHNFVLTPTNDNETALVQKVKVYLEARGAQVVLMPPEEHDEMMSVVSEDPEFYSSLQMSLPHMVEIETRFQQKVKIWADLVKNRDRQGFIRRMNSLKNELEEDPDFKQSYGNLYQLVEMLPKLPVASES